MDKQGRISKAHTVLIESLTEPERLLFENLSLEHQHFVVGFCVADDVDFQVEVEPIIEGIKRNLWRIRETSEGRETWQQWLCLKEQTREIMEIRDLARLLFIPYETERTGDKRLTMQTTAANVIAGFWVAEGYIEPYLYPWQTAMKNILYKEGELPNINLWTPQERRMFYAESPTSQKIHAQIHIDDMTQAAKAMPGHGRLHPEKIIPVWRSYLPTTEPCKSQQQREETQDRYARWQQRVDELATLNPKLSHSAICKRIATETGDHSETIRKATTKKPKPTNV